MYPDSIDQDEFHNALNANNIKINEIAKVQVNKTITANYYQLNSI